MESLLERAFAEAAKLPKAEQDVLASRLLAELAVEDDFDRAIAGSAPKLRRLAEEAIAEFRGGSSEELRLCAPSRFVIRNGFAEHVLLNIEPEGAILPLGSGEEVPVIDRFVSEPVTITCSKSDDGCLIISIWPGDGEVRVERDGVDVLDLM